MMAIPTQPRHVLVWEVVINGGLEIFITFGQKDSYLTKTLKKEKGKEKRMKKLRYSLLTLGLAVLFLTTSYAQDSDIDVLRASDVNTDGTIDILDLTLIASHFNETVAPDQTPDPDINDDGIVNILDLTLVARHFGKTVPITYFVNATPPGGEIAANATISITFDNAPADVTVSEGTVTVAGKTATVSGPFTPGPLVLTITWADGTQNLNYTVAALDTTAPTVTGGTVKDGDQDVDPEAINSDAAIEITFSKPVSGNIALQTEDGFDVGWLGNVKGNKAILELVKGRELGDATTYVIIGRVVDSAGNTTEISINFTTADIPFTLAENLIDIWLFDDGEGNIATNSSGTHDGEIVGSQWTFGVFDDALEFDGVDDVVVVKDYPTFDISQNMTFMAWFRPTDTLTHRSFIVKHDAFYVGFSEQNRLKFGVQPNDISVESVDPIGSRWYHLAVTFDAKTLRIYINGQLNSVLPHDVPMAPSEADLLIGQGFSGVIDEVRIYNKALSENEIEDAYTGEDYF